MTLLRSALFNAFFFGSTFLLVWPGTLLRFIAPGQLLRFVRGWARLELAALRILCGIRYQVTGLERLPADGPVLVASRHESAFDTLVWTVLLPRCCYVLKQELVRIPLFGAMAQGAGMIAVDRQASITALHGLLKQGVAAAAAGRQIVIFPEGTRAEPGARPPLQPGVAALASRAELAVFPVATNSGQFWGKRAFHKRPGVIQIRIGPPIPPATPRRLLVQQLEAGIHVAADALRRPVDNSVDSPPSGFAERARKIE